MFAHSAESTAAAVAACKRSGLPLWAKLSPNTSDLIEIAGAALEAGAEALTLVNTLLGLAIDERTAARRARRWWRRVVGTGDPCRRPAGGLRLSAAYPGASIVGVGGIADGAGALRMLAAGACAVQVGTATLADPVAPRTRARQGCAGISRIRASLRWPR